MEQNEFKSRRQKLIDIIGISGMAILPATLSQNFYYVTGFPESNAVVVLIPQREQGQYILFCHTNNNQAEIYSTYEVDDVFSITELDDIIPGLLETCQRLYYPLGYDSNFDNKVIRWINQLKTQIHSSVPNQLLALDHILHEMRLYKTEAETDAMRAASQALVQVCKRAMQFCRPNLYEYELEAEIVHELIRNGCSYPPYPIVVAGGKNTNRLDYSKNNEVLNNNELVLVDVGVKLDYYTATITRTFPVNGFFTKPQKLIYELVLKAQQASINKIYPGNSWIEPHKAATEIITQELIQLDLLIGKFNTLIEEEAYKRFYPQQTCYWLGMDVRDCGNYKIDEVWRNLEPNMVMTVESRINILPSEDIAEEWWNIGICIKDNILITSTGHEVLTIDLPKASAEIENFMAILNS
jgi:Xaa-Pro aminopeptidase